MVAGGAALVLAALTAAGPSPLALILAVVLVMAGGALLLPALARLTPPGTLRCAPGLPAAVLTRGLLTFAYFAGDAYVTLTLTSVRHTSTTYAGLTLTVATLTWTGGAWVQARVIQRSGPRVLIRSGLALVILGLVGFTAILSHAVPVVMAPVAWGVAGLGMGLAYSPTSLTTLGWAIPGQEGKASSAVQLTDVLGTSLGTGVSGAAIAIVHQNAGDPRLGLVIAFGVAAVVGLAGLALSPRLPDRTTPP
jgi:MFS family permease